MSSVILPTPENDAERRQALIARMQFLGQMASTEAALFHQAAASKNGLGITDMKTISTLMQEGPKTAGELAKRLSLTTGAVTNVVDRLTRRKLVKRQPHPKDRRKVVVAANEHLPDGRMYQDMGEAFSKLLSGYTTEQITFLAKYFEDTIELTKQQIAKLQTEPTTKY